MEIPIQLAVRVYSQTENENSCVQTTSSQLTEETPNITTGFVNVAGQNFPVGHAFPADATQNQIYQKTIFPLIQWFLEGFDASIVTYGQKGKTNQFYK